MNRLADNTTPWSDCPLVFLPPPPVAHCPRCGVAGPHGIVRSRAEADRSVTRRCVCRTCNQRFVVVVDPDGLPAAGKTE